MELRERRSASGPTTARTRSSAPPSSISRPAPWCRTSPSRCSLGNGVIEATGLEVTDNGKVLHFSGRVRTVFENVPADRTGAQGGRSRFPAPPTASPRLQPTSLSR